MNKLINYFEQGKGRGLRSMLIFSILIGLLTWGIAYYSIKELPQNTELNAFIEQLPTIVIQDGIVTEPANVNNSYSFENQPIFYLQSDRDTVSLLSANGFYLTRKHFTVIANGEVKSDFLLKNTITITHASIVDAIRTFVFWLPIIWGIIYFTIIWLYYLIVVGISSLIIWIGRFKLNKGTIWRSASFAAISILLIDISVSAFGYSIGYSAYPLLIQLFLSILLVLLITFGIHKKEEKEIKK